MKQVEVSILGQTYLLGCPVGGETLLAASVAAVDREMTAIRESGKVRARERIAVLAALNIAYQLAEHGPTRSHASTSATSESPLGAGSAERGELDALMARVDSALGGDGQLL